MRQPWQCSHSMRTCLVPRSVHQLLRVIPTRSFAAAAGTSTAQDEAGGTDNGDEFMCFAPSFDAYPCTGQLLQEHLEVQQGSVPAGPGQEDRTGFQLWQQQLCIQGQMLTLVGPANINSVTFWYWRRGLKGMDPFWARPWPSGLALADLILREPSIVRGRRVIELGAGVGAPGIAAALAGALEVCITDRETLSLECAALSAQACGLHATVSYPDKVCAGTDGGSTAGGTSHRFRDDAGAGAMQVLPSTSVCSDGTHVKCDGDVQGLAHAVRAAVGGSGNETSCSGSVAVEAARQLLQQPQLGYRPLQGVEGKLQSQQELPPAGAVTCALLDWSEPVPEELLGRFDLVIATDVLYEHLTVPMLASVVGQLTGHHMRTPSESQRHSGQLHEELPGCSPECSSMQQGSKPVQEEQATAGQSPMHATSECTSDISNSTADHLPGNRSDGILANTSDGPEPGSDAAVHLAGRVRAGLLLAEYPDRYPTNLKNFRELLQASPQGMQLSNIREELVPLPCFVNEMLDIELDPEHPSVKTDFLLFECA